MFTRIVVPLDGSELAEVALAPAEELAALYRAPIHLVRVLDVSGVVRAGGFPVYNAYIDATAFQEALLAEQDDSARYLSRIEERERGKGLAVSSEALNGSPAESIVATTKSGDLIVMSTHGRGGLTRWFLGSVAESVLRHAAVPVMIVRAAAVAKERSGPPSGDAA